MIEALLRRTRLIATLVMLVSVLGLLSWSTMPRQEDPSFVDRFGSLVVALPGASSLDVERLVLEPLEDRLEEVAELDRVVATARTDVAVFELRLKDSLGGEDTAEAWEKVRQAVETGARDLPVEAHAPVLDTQVGDPATAVFFVSGSSDLLELRAAAKTLQRKLQKVPGVERVVRVGDPGREVHVTLSPETATRLQISPGTLAQRIQAQNITLPGGTLEMQGRGVVLRHLGELASTDAIAALPIALPNGASVPLGSIATVQEAQAVPRTGRVLYQGLPVVGVSVVPSPEQNLVALGDRIEAALNEVGPTLAPLSVERFAFQPAQVDARISELTGSLLFGMGIVAVVLFATMGMRMGTVVSVIVPLVALGSVGIYAFGGGVLHQISIAALVLALGLLVDNAIVVAESVQQNIDAGVPDPGMAAVRELAVPLGTATGTTVAAFVPMLLSSGGTADFTRTIPLMVILTLLLSYVYALVVTPLLAAKVLRPSSTQSSRLDRLGQRLSGFTTRRPLGVLALVGVGMLATVGLSLFVSAEFFPMSDREQVIVSVELPEGAAAKETERVVQEMVASWAADPAVQTTTAFVGGGLPRFYYNLNDSPNSPHRAEVVLSAPGADLAALQARLRTSARAWPEASVVAKRLQQGPPVGAPVQIRLQGEDLADLELAVASVTSTLRAQAGARDVRHTLGTGMPTLEFTIDDHWNTRLGNDRGSLPLSTLARTQGLSAGQIRNGSDPIDIRVRSPEAELTSPERLLTATVSTPSGPVPVLQLAEIEPRWGPASIRHRNGEREVTVAAELAEGATFASVLSGFEAAVPELPAGVRLSYGGEAEGSGEANAAILSTLPVGAGLLVFFLLLEFDSFRRLGIILSTVPLAAMGVIPGLALTGQPFGFMSMLGVFALMGIVVNNAIVLLNVIEHRRSKGADLESAVREAVKVRLRPILLTSLTTVAGMVPLALSSSALWPPLASAMISGLVASTVLTLVVVPALYMVLFRESNARPWRWLSLGLWLPGLASAAPMTLDQVMVASQNAPELSIAHAEADALRRDANGAWLDRASPLLSAGGQALALNAPVELDTRFGPLVQQPKNQRTWAVRVQQPLLDPSGWSSAHARSRGADAQRAQVERQAEIVAAQAADLFLNLVVTDAARDALAEQAAAVETLAARAQELSDAGLATEVDVLRAQVALANVRQTARGLDTQRADLHDTLQLVLHTDTPIEPEFDADTSPAPSTRPDRLAMRQATRAAQSERLAHASSMLPRLSAELAWEGSDNESLVKSNWGSAGIQASWTLGLGSVARVDAASARLRARRTSAELLDRQIQLEQASGARAIELQRANLAVSEVALELSERAVQVLEDRYRQQLVPITEVLTAQAERAQQRTAVRQAQVEGVRARVKAALAGS